MASHSIAAAYPGRPPHILAKIGEVEQELDFTWPGWRQRQPFAELDYDRLARIKYLLKRHALLTYEQGGVPAPRDWGVIVVRDKANPSQCYAHPIVPDRPLTGDVGEPPPVVHVEPAPLPSASELAFAHRVPLEHVEAAMAALPPLPPGVDPVELVVRLARHIAGKAPALEVAP